MNWALSIAREAIADVTLVEEPSRALEEGETRLAVRRFAVTANNITYAAFGTVMRYWDFFPGHDDRGRLPVWGFAEITETSCADLTVGERIYGYFPAGSELIVRPGKVEEGSFIDFTTHRAELPPAYNRYVRCAVDPLWSPAREAAQMVLQPLFITSFLLATFLRDENAFGASSISLTSASSKTAIALAWLLKANPVEGVTVRALTSNGNADFVKGLDLYDEIVTYDALGSLPRDERHVVVDFAGSSDINTAIHTHLVDQLMANIRVGGAHWQKSMPASDLPGPKPQFFFAPDHARARIKEWGQEAFDGRYRAGWDGFADAGSRYFDYAEEAGGEAALDIYKRFVAGGVPASAALTVGV